MLKAGEILKRHYVNMLHVTCLAHALHRVCEFIRDEFSLVNSFVNNFKKILLKAPHRTHLYRQCCPALPLPPQPVITRWGTWIEFCNFYADHYEALKTFVSRLSDEAQSISKCKLIMNDPTVYDQLHYIKTHFGFLPNLITQLEGRNIPLTESFSKFNTCMIKLKSYTGDFGARLSNKINNVINRNPDFQSLFKISLGLFDEENLLKYANLYSNFTLAPVTSCDVERSFSTLKDLLSSKRTKLTHENLEKLIFILVNNNTRH